MGINAPKVSVIMPVYHVEEFLEKSLTSVVEQTLKDIEIICINNGASDAEIEILNMFAESDSRIKIINFEENQGYGKALNTGFDNARGEFLSIIESDDYADKNMLEYMYNKVSGTDADIIKSAFTDFNEKREFVCLNNLNLPVEKEFRPFDCPNLFSEHPSIWSCLYRREFIKNKNIRFVEAKGTGWVDNPFRMETLTCASKMIYVPIPFYHYRDAREGSASNLGEGISVPYTAVRLTEDVVKKYDIKDENVLHHFALLKMTYISRVISLCSLNNRKIAEDTVNKLFESIGTALNENKKFIKLKKRYYKKSLLLRCIKNSIKDIIRRKKK